MIQVKRYTITTNSIFDDLKVETDKNIAIFKDIYVQDENEDYLIELRDADTHRKYTYQSRAIDMFVHDVMSPLKGIKGYFDIYLINSMHGKHYSSGSYDYVKMEAFASVMIEFVKKIIFESLRVYDPERKSKDSFDGYIEQDDVELFSFKFDVPTFELKNYCEQSSVDYTLLRFPRAGFFPFQFDSSAVIMLSAVPLTKKNSIVLPNVMGWYPLLIIRFFAKHSFSASIHCFFPTLVMLKITCLLFHSTSASSPNFLCRTFWDHLPKTITDPILHSMPGRE